MRVAIVITALILMVALVPIACGSSDTFPVSDEAVIELSTLNALQGHQLLGPYSRYSWHHPGPALFYLLAPFYGASRQHSTGLAAGALWINLVALMIAAWVLFRSGGPSLSVAFAAVTILFVARMPDLLVSAWNAHVAVVTSMAVLAIGAAAVSGAPASIPLLAALASFVVQTHIAMLPVAALAAVTGVVAIARSRDGVVARRAINRSLWVLLALWLVPLVEQLAPGGGNVSRMWSFAAAPSTGAALPVAFEAWAEALLGVFLPGFALPRGLLLPHDGAFWPGLAVAVELLLLAVVAWRAHRRGRRFHSWLAIVLIAVSVAAFFAVRRIPDGIHDHEVFWISAVGLLNAATVAAAALERLDAWRGVSAALAALMIAGVAVEGRSALIDLADRSRSPSRDDRWMEDVTLAVRGEMARAGAKKPKILIDQPVWVAAAGVILQLRKIGTPVAVEPGLEKMFSGTTAADGSEDLEITFCGGPCHERLAARPDNAIVWNADGLAIDARARLGR